MSQEFDKEIEDRREVRKIIVQKSNELLKAQLESYLGFQRKAQIVTGFTSIFFTTYLAFIGSTNSYFKIATSISLLILITGMYYAVTILNSRDIGFSMNEKKFEEYLNLSLEDFELREIATNKYLIEENDELIAKIEKSYKKCLVCISLSVLFSIITMYFNFLLKS